MYKINCSLTSPTRYKFRNGERVSEMVLYKHFVKSEVEALRELKLIERKY